MKRLPRVVFALLLVATVALWATGWALGGRSEVLRTAHVAADQADVHAALIADVESTAAPFGRLTRTATHPSRGLWYDGPEGRRLALLHARTQAGTRVDWYDVLHVGASPFARIRAWAGRERRAAEIDAALARVRAAVVR